MTRTSYRPLAALALAATLVAYVGCHSGSSSPSQAPTAAIGHRGDAKADGADAGSGSNSNTNTKLFADWPEPAAALFISGEQDGYLEPCGCTSGQLGGLRRRYDLIERTRARKWPLVLIDLGSLIKDPATARGGPEQAKIKFSVALTALTKMGYHALALSAEDLKIGVGEALGQYLNLGEGPKVVVANVKPAEGFGSTIVPSVTVPAGPFKIGITAVLDPEALKRIRDQDKEVVLPTVLTPEEALPGVLAKLERETDTQVLMVQGPPELARALGQKFPAFDIVVATSHFDPDAEPQRINDGKTMVISVGQKGKYVGVVGLFSDSSPKYRYQRLSLISRYNGEAEPMRKLIEEDFQEMLKQQGVVERFPRRGFTDAAPGAVYAGAETCKQCHPKTYAVWAGTKHAHAFESIVHDPKGERSDHQFDAECVSCHTTGFEYTSGWRSAEATPHLKGNQCENCHGPASKHVESPTNPDFRKAIARTAEAADKTRLCIRCHDEDNSPNFNFATYWSKIAHKGLDTYDDPKVREGIAPAPGAK